MNVPVTVSVPDLLKHSLEKWIPDHSLCSASIFDGFILVIRARSRKQLLNGDKSSKVYA